MKNRILIYFIILLIGTLSVQSCRKDSELDKMPIPTTEQLPSPFKQYAWAEKEAPFFSLDNQSGNTVNARTNGQTVFHPLVIEAYNEIAAQNEQHHFVEAIVPKVGLPLWQQSYVYANDSTSQSLVLIPLSFAGQTKLSGLIAVNKSDGRYIINGMSRAELLQTEQGNAVQKGAYAEWMYQYEQWLFESPSEELLEAYCTYLEETTVNADPTDPGDPNSSGDPTEPCVWRILELCVDENTQTSWIGGHNNLPLHLDHDRDGILNKDDQDWHEFQQRTGITQEEFERRVVDWWNRHHRDEQDREYHEFFNDHSNQWNPGNQHLGGLWEWLEDLWDDFWDFFGGNDPIDDIYFDPHPGRDFDQNCNFFGGLSSEETGDRNSIRCNWYYVLDCGGSGDHWWDIFDEIVDCPSCPGYQDYQDQFRDRLHDYWQNRALRIEFGDLANLIGEQCDAFAPGFESCVQSIYDEYRSLRINAWIEDFRLTITPDDLMPEADDCNLSSGFGECLWNAHFENNFSDQAAVIDFLIAYNPDLAALDAEFAAAPAWMWPIIKELGVEAVAQLIERQFKIKLASEVIDAVRSIGQSDFKGFMLAAFDIVSQFHPATRGFKALWDTIDIGKKALQTWRKIKNLANEIGEQAMTRVWGIAANTATKFNEKYLRYVNDLDYPKLGVAPRVNYRLTFKKEFPEVYDNVHQVHHAVPKKVYERYHGIITREELHSIENLRGIPINDSAMHNIITVRWNRFYENLPNFTRQKALDFAKQIYD
ncbi:MAG: hypothetical protein AAGG75_25575 [Bacteroidota bacterium]